MVFEITVQKIEGKADSTEKIAALTQINRRVNAAMR